MKVLVTGANGQLGTDVVRLLHERGLETIGLTRNEMDITDEHHCTSVINNLMPDAIIHCAAYTAVDAAEEDMISAFRVNTDGTRNLAVLCGALNIKFCYISTDYVFDGTSRVPYTEYDNTNPITVYGKSKLAGELLTHSLCSRYYIVRTSWVYGSNGNNFVKTMLKLGNEKKEINVVSDQCGSPTYTRDLAKFLGDLILTERYGIYHASNQGHCSWYEFAQAIFIEAGKQDIQVNPCTTQEYPRPAPRPAYSVMRHIAIETNGFQLLPDWRNSLKEFIKCYNG